MTEKFTEEQYQKIVKSNDDKASMELFITLAIANPLTREWAHEQFVEEEKKYYWTSKDGTKSGKMHRRLYKGGFSKIHDIYIEDRYPKSENEELTKSEVMSSVYNPDMFDREEA